MTERKVSLKAPSSRQIIPSGNSTLKAPVYPEFDDIPVSTKTFIITTNLAFDIQKLFEFLPITEYVLVPKKRGRKKKINIIDPNKNIPSGSIITLDLTNKIRGVVLKKKLEGKEPNFFRNSMTVVMYVDNKKINFKISRNGKFQMTGCKKDKQAEDCITHIWEYIKDTEGIYTFTEKDYFRAIFIPAMRNIDFSLGFIIDREKLDEYVNTSTDYYSLLETSIGYTGVNIKIPITKSITDLKIREITYKNGAWKKPKLVPFQKYLDLLKPKEQQKKLDKERLTTLLVFQSGKVILSSMCEEFALDGYREFISIIQNNYKKFRETLDDQLEE